MKKRAVHTGALDFADMTDCERGRRNTRLWRMFVLLVAISFALDAFGSHHDTQNGASQDNRKDPAFVVGYDKGYRRGAVDSMTLSDAYRDESGRVYEQAIDGYTPQYGDRAGYQRLFREGYIAGYKAGWDFEAGQYSVSGVQ